MESNLFKEKEIPGLTICARQTDHVSSQVYVLLSHVTAIFNDRHGLKNQQFFLEIGTCNTRQRDLRSSFLFKNASGFRAK